MLDQTASVETFLAATAARQPTPGGGSVAALTGATAASLAEMVLNYSVGKKDLVAHQAELAAALAEMTQARKLFLGLMVEDQIAFESLSAARKLADGAAGKNEAVTAAVNACLSVPQVVAATGLAVLEVCDRAKSKVNKHLISDLAIAADLATATVRGGVYNVRINLAEVTDSHERATIEKSVQKLLTNAIEIIQRVSPAVSNL